MSYAGKAGGFTLLEMLFVMFVVGLLVSLTVPRFAASYEQRELLTQRADIEDQLREMPRRVRLNAHPLQLPRDLKSPDLGNDAVSLRLPPGWAITFDPELQISLMGVCSATKVTLELDGYPSLSARYQIAPINCELTESQQ